MPISKQQWQSIIAPCLLMVLFFTFDAFVIQYFSFKNDITRYLIYFVILCISHYWLSSHINISLKNVLLLSALVKIPLIFSQPFLSDDIYRYLWDGFVSLNGINPYAFAPNAYALEPLTKQFDLHVLINHPQFSTLYLAVPQFLFYISGVLFNSIEGLKSIFLAFDLGSIYLLSKLIQTNRSKTLVLYAFHPLILMETYSSGHLEIVYVFFVLLALYAYQFQKKRMFLSAVILSVLTKGYSFLYLTFKRKWLVPFVVCSGILFFNLSLLTQNTENGLSAYHSQFSFNNPIFSIFHFYLMPYYHEINNLIPYTVFCKLLVFILVSFVIYLLLRPVKESFGQFVFFISLVLVFASATIYPWYLLVLIPLALLNGNTLVLPLSYTTSLSYIVLHTFVLQGIWQETPETMLLCYLPVILAFSTLIRQKFNQHINEKKYHDN